MPIESPTARGTGHQEVDRRWRARRPRALWHRFRCLHGRSFVYPAIRLPVAHRQDQSRSVAARSRGVCRQQLRRLRGLRRGGARCSALSVVLSGRCHRESDRVGSVQGTAAVNHHSPTGLKRSRPITLTIAALGGQGGGVVTDWLVMAARSAGYFVQATSVPGVAQRTGATIYYLEFFPRGDAPEGREPIMALMPNPGDVDIVVASEWMEAGRAINRGLVTQDRTTLIASTHRDYTIGEKIALGEGRASSRELFEVASAAAARLIGFDMPAIAEAAGGRISAVILGSIAGAAVLPWGIEEYQHAIKESGVGVEASLAAFEAGRLAVITAAEKPLTAAAWPDSRTIDSSDYTLEALSAQLRQRIESRFPAALRELLGMAAARLSDYQDDAYADLFLDRIERIAVIDTASSNDAKLTAATARSLGLWMSFEDVMRVAQLKTRRGRAERIRREVKANPKDL